LQARSEQLVLPALANIVSGRVSILTPMGAALYGLMGGQLIEWPDLDAGRDGSGYCASGKPSPVDPPAAA
jgi:transcription elongation GreA/GreB family factor